MRDHLYRLIDAGRWQLSLAALDGLAMPAADAWQGAVERGLNLNRLGLRASAIRAYLQALSADPENRAVLEATLAVALEEGDLKTVRSLLAHILSGPFDYSSPTVLAALTYMTPPFGCVQMRDGVASGWVVGRGKTIQVESLGQRGELTASFATPQLQAASIGDGANGFAVAAPTAPAGASSVMRFGIEGVSLWGSPVDASARSSLQVSAPPAAIPLPQPLHVLVPVFGGEASLRRCLDGLARSTGFSAAQVWVIEDCPTEAGVRQAVRDTCQRHGFRLLSRSFNAGFSAAVNSGLRVIPAGDVILLNSDTVVCDDWALRLQSVAYSARDVATVTPLSGNGELLSHPRPMQAAPQSASLAPLLDRLCRKSKAKPVEIPTGVGFCLFIRADARQAAGDIDEVTFGRGYAEETDYCLRLSCTGWRHLAAPNVFVGHEGGASFGAERSLLAARNVQTIYAKYPEHSDEYASWLASDPLKAVRNDLQAVSMPHLLQAAGVDEVLLGAPADVLAWLQPMRSGDGEGGAWMSDALEAPAAYLSLAADKATLHFQNVPLLDLVDFPYPTGKKALFSALSASGIRTFVVRSLSPMTLKFLENCSDAFDLVFSLDDASGFCPRRSATVERGKRCPSKQTAADCDACVSRLGPVPARSATASTTAAWRRRVDKQLARATRILVGEAKLGQQYLQHFPNRSIDVPDASGDWASPAGLLGRFGPDASFAAIGANSVEAGFAHLCDALLESFRVAPGVRFFLLGQHLGSELFESYENATLLRNVDGARMADLLRPHGCRALLVASRAPGADSQWAPLAQALGLPLITLISGAFS